MLSDNNFLPITLGASLKSVKSGDLTITETTHSAGLRLPLHRHEPPNIVVVLNGSFLETTASRNFECTAGNILIKPPGIPHSNFYGTHGAQCLIIEFNQSFLDVLSLAKLFREMQSLHGTFCSALVKRMYREFCFMDDASFLAIEGLALELFSFAMRRRSGASALKPQWLLKAQTYIHENYAESLTLSQISEYAGVHPSHLSRAFRTHYQTTVGEFIRNLRLERAIEQMSKTNESLGQIALDAGFYDQSHFTNAFKKYTGKTPRQFLLSARR